MHIHICACVCVWECNYKCNSKSDPAFNFHTLHRKCCYQLKGMWKKFLKLNYLRIFSEQAVSVSQVNLVTKTCTYFPVVYKLSIRVCGIYMFNVQSDRCHIHQTAVFSWLHALCKPIACHWSIVSHCVCISYGHSGKYIQRV